MAKRHIKRCSTLLIIREMQVKTAMRYYLTPDKIAIIKKSASNKYWRGCGREPSYSVSGNVDITATMVSNMKFPLKPKTRASI